MAKKEYLGAGVVVGPHRIRGGVKLKPWCDSPEALLAVDRFRLDDTELKVTSIAVHGGLLLCTLEGYDSIDAVLPLKGRVLLVHRDDIPLPEGRRFIQDLLGMAVRAEDGALLGALKEVLNLPAGEVYVVEGARRYMIPAVPEFILGVDERAGIITVRLLEGMETDAH